MQNMTDDISKKVPGLKEAYHLTKKQEAVLNFIQDYTEKNGFSPSQAEIQHHFGYKSPNSVEGYLRALRKSGVISSTPGKARNILINQVNPELKIERVSIMGKVTAGNPADAPENVDRSISFSQNAFDSHVDYFLRVDGYSMSDAGIFPGDLIAVNKTEEAKDGDIIIARINNDAATTKRYHREGNIVWLEPACGYMENIRIDLDKEKCTIDGLFVGLVRPNALNMKSRN